MGQSRCLSGFSFLFSVGGHRHQSPPVTPSVRLGTVPYHVSAPYQTFPLYQQTKVSSNWLSHPFILGPRASSHHTCFFLQELEAWQGPSFEVQEKKKKSWWENEVLHKISIGLLSVIPVFLIRFHTREGWGSCMSSTNWMLDEKTWKVSSQ